MNETDIRKYAGLMRELGLTGLEITEDNKVVRLERTAQTVVQSADMTSVPAEKNVESQTSDGNYISVKSAFVGVFYAAPKENAKPYVSVGDRGCFAENRA